MKLFFFLILFSAGAFAQDFYQAIEEQMNVIQGITFKTAREMNGGSCVRRYEGLLQDKTLNILQGFGYTDNTPHDTVYDWYMVNGFIRAIMEPCRQGISACEFTRSRQDPDKFIKTIYDRNNNPVRVELVIIRGSISGSHHANIAAKNVPARTLTVKWPRTSSSPNS